MTDCFISVTIPFGRGYEEPKVTVHGTLDWVKQQIAVGFGVKLAEDMTLCTLVSDASNIALALGNIRDEFPGTQSVPGGGKAKEPTEDERLIAHIEAETSIEQLHILYAEEKAQGRPLESRPDVWAAWNKRGLELQQTATKTEGKRSGTRK